MVGYLSSQNAFLLTLLHAYVLHPSHDRLFRFCRALSSSVIYRYDRLKRMSPRERNEVVNRTVMIGGKVRSIFSRVCMRFLLANTTFFLS